MKYPKNKPPKIFQWLFAKVVPAQYLEELMGDQEEMFASRASSKGKSYAVFMHFLDTMHLIFGFSRKARFKSNTNQWALFKNYVTISRRNMLKHKFYSAINVIGLATGISMSLLITIHVRQELSYDTTYPKHKLIYRLASTNYAAKPPIMGLEFKEKIPEVKAMTRLFAFEPKVLSYGKEDQLVQRPFLADHSIIEILDLEFIEGNDKDALTNPSSILLTESVANRLFKPGEKRIGEVIDFDDGWRQTVTGIIKDFPKNTHLKLETISSMERSYIGKSTDRSWAALSIYVLFNAIEDAESAKRKLLDFQVQFFDGMASEEEIKEHLAETGEYLELQPLTDIHLHSHRNKEIETNSNIIFVYVFAALAAFILLVVIINFVNLHVAQTLNRIKEIGLRKTLGAYRKQLIFQFFSEAFFLVLLAGVLAVLIAYLALPYYNNLALIPISVSELFSISNLKDLALLILLVGLLTGGFPALYLSKMQALKGLSGAGLKVNSKLPLRNTMVAFQFFISICMLTATLIINEQMRFIEAKDMGFAKEEVVAIQLHKNLKIQAILYPEKLKSELKRHSDITAVSFSSHLIGSRFSLEPTYLQDDPEHQVPSRYLVADHDILETMGVEILDGRLEKKTSGRSQYFLNETAARLFQKEDIIGKTIVNSWVSREGEIAGIVKDFHYASLHNQVEPLVIELSDNQNAQYYLVARVNTKNLAASVKKIEDSLLEIAPGSLIVPLLIDEHMDVSYRAENNMFSIFKFFSTIIIGLACIGLFALFAFIVQARTKEMGIRKTLGASLPQLLLVLSKNYLIILATVAVAAVPLIQLLASDWLNSFAFRVTPSWWTYLLPATIILLLAALAIILQSMKVAKVNPVEVLKDE